MRRTFLLEDMDDEVENTEFPISNMINQMIKGEWDAIDLYNSISETVKGMNLGDEEDILETIKDITEEEYIHVGQLEKLLQMINPSAENILDGAQEAAEELGDKEQVEISAEN